MENIEIEKLLPQFSKCQNENRKIKEELNFLTQKIYKCLDEYKLFVSFFKYKNFLVIYIFIHK